MTLNQALKVKEKVSDYDHMVPKGKTLIHRSETTKKILNKDEVFCLTVCSICDNQFAGLAENKNNFYIYLSAIIYVIQMISLGMWVTG